ncbi:hypothetical protein ES332_D10G273700v1 [Gossypium tomentosum]|uniref:Uncharacterized protein n=1 Tax=Gossypium tomentosum TaxID=34277 RepID=A0A5D2JAV0_GOSTO|nr:hypothetical protein ES332_D10G273700v1 [Gossypium tomentosum]
MPLKKISKKKKTQPPLFSLGRMGHHRPHHARWSKAPNGRLYTPFQGPTEGRIFMALRPRSKTPNATFLARLW